MQNTLRRVRIVLILAYFLVVCTASARTAKKRRNSRRVLPVAVRTADGDDSPPEASIAYFIQISDSTVTLLPRLLRILWHERNTYIIHFDKKIPEYQRRHARSALFKGTGQKYNGNVHIMPSEMVTYRGISMVLNLLSAMQFALDRSSTWSFFINVSGSDYPLVSPLNQRRLLARNDFLEKKRSFFSFSDEFWWKESKVFRFDRLFTDTSLSLNDTESRVIDSYTEQPLAKMHNFTFTAAEAWMILHRSFVNHLLRSSYARRMLLAFSYALEPEEHYFSTVAFNSPRFNATNVPHALRYVAWVHNGVHSGQHPYYIDKQEPDGKTWTFQKKIELSGCMFARKIRSQNSGFLTYIDSHINGISDTPNAKDVSAYLARATRSVDCIARYSSGDFAGDCFNRKD